MFKSKNCLSCTDYKNCYILHQLKRVFVTLSNISEIQITDFDFKCSHFHEHLKQVKITDYVNLRYNEFKCDTKDIKNFNADNGFD